MPPSLAAKPREAAEASAHTGLALGLSGGVTLAAAPQWRAAPRVPGCGASIPALPASAIASAQKPGSAVRKGLAATIRALNASLALPMHSIRPSLHTGFQPGGMAASGEGMVGEIWPYKPVAHSTARR